MAYSKGKGGGSMNSPKGMCSYAKNPMKAPSKVSAMCGPGSNPDQMKANKLLQKAQKQIDSQRGMMGM